MSDPIRRIEVVPYQNEWPAMFAAEAEKIQEALGTLCLEVHHIGSTSVPGLVAKPLMDIMPVVSEVQGVDRYNAQMQALGYEPRGEHGIFFRRFFQKIAYGEVVCNVHVFEVGDTEIDRYLRFRDWMRSHADDRDAYAALKKRLAVVYPTDMFSYVTGKTDFVKSIDLKAGWHGQFIRRCMSPDEWDAYHRIRREQVFNPIGVVYNPEHPTMISNDHYHCVLCDDYTVVSVMHLELFGDDTMIIRSLATDVGRQGRGYGTYLMQSLERWARHQGRSVIQMHANPKAEAFYRKLGYSDMPFDEPSIAEHVIDLGKYLH